MVRSVLSELQEKVAFVEANFEEIITCRHANHDLLELALDLHPAAITRVTYALPQRLQSIYALTRDDVQHLVDPSEETQLLIVERNPRLITRLRTPCVAAQVTAVRAEPKLLARIDSPCIEAVRAVREVAPRLLRAMVLPSEFLDD